MVRDLRAEDATGEPGTDHVGDALASSKLTRRRRVVVRTAAVTVVLSVSGLAGSRWVQSPSQAAADTRPPKASVITAPVVRQVLRSTVVLRGTFSDGRTVSATPTSVASTSASSRPAQLLVTGVYVHPGQHVGASKALVEYSGRPVFALPGVLPAYRDLTYGEQGKDIAQLQLALASLGHPIGSDADGVFGSGTESAVRALYSTLGYPVAISTDPVDGASGVSGTDGAGGTGGSGTAAGGTGAAGGTAGEPRTPVPHAMVPASEVVFVPTLPARVVSVPVQVGDPVKGSVITLARGGMTLTGMLDPSQAGLVAAGMKAQVLSEVTGATSEGMVQSVGALVAPGDGKSAAAAGQDQSAQVNGGFAYLPLTIRPDRAWDSRFAGQDVRITITAAATTVPVQAVPQAAISAGADARSTVTVVGAGGVMRTIQIKAGVSADGLVQVTPLDGTLTTGEKVVVGQ